MLIPAIIAKDQEELNSLLSRASRISDTVQLDIADGKFVPNTSLDFGVSLPDNLEYEAHLMVDRPDLFIENLPAEKIGTLIFHIESLPEKNIQDFILKIKGKALKVGIAINPATPVKAVMPYLNVLDVVLVMTVEPGFYGSKFIPRALEKVSALRDAASRIKPNLEIEVDGGISDKTIAAAHNAGATRFVVGSYLLGSDDPYDAKKKLKQCLR